MHFLPNKEYTLHSSPLQIISKCNWSPIETITYAIIYKICKYVNILDD